MTPADRAELRERVETVLAHGGENATMMIRASDVHEMLAQVDRLRADLARGFDERDAL